ncbi:MAG: CapA family protein [Victivallaceae bacterium]|nr:CapA family protein [Victivallaceae bacterium]
MKKRLKIAFAADWAPIRDFAPLMTKSPEAFYHDLLPRLRQCDYRIVNLESPLSSAPFIVKSGAAFAGDPKAVNALTCVPFDAALLANNHVFDCGDAGFLDTVSALRENGIAYAGAGENLSAARKPLVIEKNHLRIAVFAMSEGEDEKGATWSHPGVRPWEVDLLADEIRKTKGDFDFVFVSLHCGLEYQPYPSCYVWEACRRLAGAGADLIAGHHPHVPQGMTFFGKTPVFFSLGNFGFYQPSALFYRKIGFYLEIEAEKNASLRCTPIPYKIANDGLHLLQNEELKEFQKLLKELSEPLTDEKSARNAWHAVLAACGIAGFEEELQRILSQWQNDPAKGAAMLRNRLLCMQHATQWRDGLSRIIDGTISDAPEKYVEMVKRYLTRKVEN